MQVCLFGLSADPPTGESGHVGVVKTLSQMDEFDQVRVLPVYRHTFSEKRNRLTSYEERLQMCRLAFSNLPKVVVSEAERESFERASKGMNDEEISSLRVGTADLLDMLIEQEPETDFFLCLGSDTFIDLTDWKWKRSKDILTLLEGRMLVIDRPDGTAVGLRERIDGINSTQQKASVRLLRVPTLEAVSSTMIRSCRDEKILQRLLVPQVLEYIKKQKMYSFADS
jgi:nicotinate (nicotinamide) nucleotide adenylyltransferase